MTSALALGPDPVEQFHAALHKPKDLDLVHLVALPASLGWKTSMGAVSRVQVQGVVFWLMVAWVLGAALLLAANRPLWWLTLSGGTLALFSVQLVLDLTDPAARRLWLRVLPIAVLYLGAVGWAAIQALPAPDPSWAHPSWAEVTARTGIPVRPSISADPDATWHGVLRYLGYAAVFWVAARGAADAERARRLVDVFALFSGALAVYGIASWAIDVNLIVGEPGYPGMVTGSFVNRNAYAFYAGIGAMACLTAIAFRVQRPRGNDWTAHRVALGAFVELLTGQGRWFALSFVILVAAVFLTGSRAGSAVTVLGIAMVIFMTFWRLGGFLRWLAALAVALPILGLSLGATILGERLTYIDPLEDQRFVIYEATWQGIWDRIELGHGLGAYQDAFRQYQPANFSGAEWDLAHSSYLENAFELGVPAAAALTLALLIVGLVIWNGISERRRLRPFMVFGLAVFLIGALHSVIDFPLQMPAIAAAFALMTATAWSLAQRSTVASAGPRKRSTRRASAEDMLTQH